VFFVVAPHQRRAALLSRLLLPAVLALLCLAVALPAFAGGETCHVTGPNVTPSSGPNQPYNLDQIRYKIDANSALLADSSQVIGGSSANGNYVNGAYRVATNTLTQYFDGYAWCWENTAYPTGTKYMVYFYEVKAEVHWTEASGEDTSLVLASNSNQSEPRTIEVGRDDPPSPGP